MKESGQQVDMIYDKAEGAYVQKKPTFAGRAFEVAGDTVVELVHVAEEVVDFLRDVARRTTDKQLLVFTLLLTSYIGLGMKQKWDDESLQAIREVVGLSVTQTEVNEAVECVIKAQGLSAAKEIKPEVIEKCLEIKAAK